MFCSSQPFDVCKFREAPDTFNFLRHVMRAILSVRPKWSHRRICLKYPLEKLKLYQSSSTRPEYQPSKPLWERNGLNTSRRRFKLFRSISWKYLGANYSRHQGSVKRGFRTVFGDCRQSRGLIEAEDWEINNRLQRGKAEVERRLKWGQKRG